MLLLLLLLLPTASGATVPVCELNKAAAAAADITAVSSCMFCCRLLVSWSCHG
jgi:hypothetical protein